MERSFSYYTTVDIIKAKSNEKDGAMIMKGVASTPSKDTQGDTLDPNGFELSYFLKNGLINWNHEWKKNPMSIIGKPTSAGINAKGELEVDYYLFKGHKMAEEVYALAKAMEENGLSLGLSIEGKVLETDPLDKKKIKRAMITDLAITPHPINLGTTTEIAKSLQLNELIDFKSLGDFQVGTDGTLIKSASTESTEDLIPESLETDTKSEIYKCSDGKNFTSPEELKKAGYSHKGEDGLYYKTKDAEKNKKSKEKLFSKSEFIKLLTQQYSGTTPEQAESVFNYVSNYKQIKMAKETKSPEKSVSEADFQAALTALNVVKSQETAVIDNVAEETEEATEEAAEATTTKSLADMTPEELADHKATLQKGLDAIEALTSASEEEAEEEETTGAAENTEEATEEEEAEESEEEATEEAAASEASPDLIKGLSTMISGHLSKQKTESDKKFQAVGELLKSLGEEIQTLKGTPLERRSVLAGDYVKKPGEIEKGMGSDELTGEVYSVSTQKDKLSTKLTDIFLAKSADPTTQVSEGIRGDLMALEAGSIVTPRLREFAKGEGITILN